MTAAASRGVSPAIDALAVDPLAAWTGAVVEVAGLGEATVGRHAAPGPNESGMTLTLTHGLVTDVRPHRVMRMARQVAGTWVRAVAAVASVDDDGVLHLGPAEMETASQRVDDRVPATQAAACWWVDELGQEHDAAGETVDVSVGGCSAWLDPVPPAGSDVALAVELERHWWFVVARCLGQLTDGRSRFEFTGTTAEAAGALTSFVTHRVQKAAGRAVPTEGLANGTVVLVRMWGWSRAAEALDAEVNPFGIAVKPVPTGFEPGDGVVVGVLREDGESRLAPARVVSKAGGKLRLAWS